VSEQSRFNSHRPAFKKWI